MRLLVAEDLKTAKAHKSALKRRGQIVTLASNGEDCLKVYNDKFKTSPYIQISMAIFNHLMQLYLIMKSQK
jgi:cadmium resistance protein CadD (predicted permease)